MGTKAPETGSEEVDTSEIPEVGDDWFKKAKLRMPSRLSIYELLSAYCGVRTRRLNHK